MTNVDATVLGGFRQKLATRGGTGRTGAPGGSRTTCAALLVVAVGCGEYSGELGYAALGFRSAGDTSKTTMASRV